jgi:hypothetical protein
MTNATHSRPTQDLLACIIVQCVIDGVVSNGREWSAKTQAAASAMTLLQRIMTEAAHSFECSCVWAEARGGKASRSPAAR